jgi:hypothetical protein
VLLPSEIDFFFLLRFSFSFAVLKQSVKTRPLSVRSHFRLSRAEHDAVVLFERTKNTFPLMGVARREEER